MIDSPALTATPEDEAPRRRGIKKGLYAIPSMFTAANIGMGFYALMAALRGFQLIGIGGDAQLQQAAASFDNAAKAICLAFLFDALDGRIARLTKTTTEIGVQLDSIADVVTFGLAPAILAYTWGYGTAVNEGSDLHNAGVILSFMYLLCGSFRLARFNVQASRPRLLAEGTVKLDKKSFVGLPIPAAALLIAAIVHFRPAPLLAAGGMKNLYSGLLMALVGCLSVLMVSTLRYTSFKSAGAQRRGTRLLVLLVACLGMLVWFYSRPVLLTLATLYASHGILFRLGSLFRRPPQKV